MALEALVKKCYEFEQIENLKATYATEQEGSVNYTRGRGRRGYQGRGYSPNYQGRGYSSPSYQDRGYGNPRYQDRGWSSGRGVSRGRAPSHVPSRGQGRSRSRGQGRGRSQGPQCDKCGRQHPYNQCPAYGQECYYCHRLNHFSYCCRRKNVSGVNNVEYERDESTNDHDVCDVNQNESFIFSCYNDGEKQDDPKKWSVTFDLKGGDMLSMKIDTGADINAISKKSYDKMHVKPTLYSSNTVINGYLGQTKSSGYVYLPVIYKEKGYELKCEIVDGSVPNILSRQDSVKLGLVTRVQRVCNVEVPNIMKHKNVVKCSVQSAKEIVQEYSDVFTGVGKMPGKVSLKIDPNFTPVAHPPRPVPAALREPLKKKLQQLEDLDIIEKVPVGVPTPWVSSLHVVLKKNTDAETDVRVTIDPKDLNKALLREQHPIGNVDDVITRLSGSRYFTALDANMGYYQIKLDEESRLLTCFNTPFGRMMYKRLPMGISSAPEIYQRKMTEIFGDIPHVNIIMDDVLNDAATVDQHNNTLKTTLQRARENNVKFSLRKLKLCSESVGYSGHILTKDGVKMDDDKLKAVLEMPEPSSISEVRTLLGMVTYTCKFLKDLSSITEPLRILIKESNDPGFEFYFDEPQKESFQTLKKLMTSAEVLRFYSLKDPITVSCDASQAGLGCVIFQNGRPVAYGSKALSDSEYAYAQIEKELLAIVFAFKKFHTYVYGRQDVIVETDHLPLLRIFEKPLSTIPLRLQRMRLKLQHYSFKLVHKKGTEIPVADALSRASIVDSTMNLAEEENSIMSISVEDVWSISSFSQATLDKVKIETTKDEVLQTLIPIITAGWPENKRQVDPVARPFYDSRDELCVLEGIVFKGE